MPRFTQPDTLVPDPTNPQDLNRYTYVRNNPTNYNDPSGHCPDSVSEEFGSVICFEYDQAEREGTLNTFGGWLNPISSGSGGSCGGWCWAIRASVVFAEAAGQSACLAGDVASAGASLGCHVLVGSAGAWAWGAADREYGVGLDEAFGAIGGVAAYGIGRWAARADAVAPSPTTFLDDATAPIGRRGSPIEIAPGTNSPATIGGRQYTGHALDRMQGRGIMPSAVDDAIRTSTPVRGADGSLVHYSQANNISVVLNTDGSVRTVSYGEFKPR